MYRHGLGDCFLLAFPKKGGGDFFVLIDCGVILGTPKPAELMKAVVADIRKTTGDHIDVLVATHEHWDHVSSFDPGKEERSFWTANEALGEEFAEPVQFAKVWMAWTEDPADAVANALRKERAEKLTALWMGVDRTRERLKLMGAEATKLRELEAAAQVLAFFGIDAAEAPPTKEGFGAAAKKVSESGTVRAMNWLRSRDGVEFLAPGASFDVDAVPGLRVHVLGPPRDPARLGKSDPTKSGRETYEEAESEKRAGFGAFALYAFPANPERSWDADPDGDEMFPFDQKFRIPWGDARAIPFFRDHYFTPGPQDWRRIDDEWAGGVSTFALQLDGDTNNTSLALAFELPDGRVLLFPGDAQVGNWESWHVDEKGKTKSYRDGRGKDVSAEILLNRTVLYKVGHHGSHNATLRARGLEMMTHPDLVAMVPVDVFIAHEKKNWRKMPFEPLMSRLDEMTRKRTIRLDGELDRNATKPFDPGPRPMDSVENITVLAGSGEGEEERRPLYVDFSLPFGRRG